MLIPIDTEKVNSMNPKQRKDRMMARKRKMIRCVDKQRDWDYSEIYMLLATKLRNILEYAGTDTVTYLENWRPEWIKRAINLADHLSHCHKYPSHININNSKRFKEASYIKFHHEDNAIVFSGIQSEIVKHAFMKVDFDRMDAEEFYDIKARHLFFKILTNYIEYWWD